MAARLSRARSGRLGSPQHASRLLRNLHRAAILLPESGQLRDLVRQRIYLGNSGLPGVPSFLEVLEKQLVRRAIAQKRLEFIQQIQREFNARLGEQCIRLRTQAIKDLRPPDRRSRHP